MDDTALILAYGTFAAAVVGVLLIVLSRGVDRKRYLRPVVYGLIFGGLCTILFGAGIFAFLMGGLVTGFFLAREVSGGWVHFRGGAINAVLIETSFVITNISLLVVRSVSWTLTMWAQNLGRVVVHEDLLFWLYVSTLVDVFFMITIVGVGAMLGGMLRKILKPGEQKPPSGSEETTSSGVGQHGVPAGLITRRSVVQEKAA